MRSLHHMLDSEETRKENRRRNVKYYREAGIPAWICKIMVDDPTLLAAQPRIGVEPIFWRRSNGVRLADWLVAELRARGHAVNPTPSEYPNQ